MKRNYLKLILFLSFFALSLATDSALAANLPYINKAKIRVSVAPGKESYGEVIVENPNEEPRSMKLYLEDWYYLPEQDGTKEFLPAATLPSSCASWINFSPAEFKLEPFGRQRISYSVKAPAGAAGGHYAVLFFETEMGTISGEEKIRGAGIDLKVRIATLFYVDVAGTVKRDVALDNLSLSKDPASAGLRVGIEMVNLGNADITAGGNFYLMDSSGVVNARGEFNNVYTFPRDKASLTSIWKEPVSGGDYDLVLTLTIGKDVQDPSAKAVVPITRETKVTIGPKGDVLKIGTLK